MNQTNKLQTKCHDREISLVLTGWRTQGPALISPSSNNESDENEDEDEEDARQRGGQDAAAFC